MTAQALTLSAWNSRRLPDENVFDRAVRGDPVAFSEVYRRYQKRIYGFCLARSLDPETAADATQEVFMKLLRAEPGSIENPRAWLFTVARNVVIDAARKRQRTPEDTGVEPDAPAWDRLKAADTADEVLARSDARNVFLALRTVRPRYRTALIMREIHGQSAKDMAEALEMSPGAVDTLVSRARDAFGVAYAAVGDLPSGCRATVELIYRRTGTGITDSEQTSLDAHLAECARCRAEADRAADPRHLGALLPFLVPANTLAHGVLRRAAMTARSFPDVAVQHAAPVLLQPHTWTLGTKIAAGLVAAVLVTAPIAGGALKARHAAVSSPTTISASLSRSASPEMGGSTTLGRLTAPIGTDTMTSPSGPGSSGGMSSRPGVGSGTRAATGGSMSKPGPGTSSMSGSGMSSGTGGFTMSPGAGTTSSGSGSGSGTSGSGMASGGTRGSGSMGSGSGSSMGGGSVRP
jgi:RNA polymerase sigma factor (sigma-70 family)